MSIVLYIPRAGGAASLIDVSDVYNPGAFPARMLISRHCVGQFFPLQIRLTATSYLRGVMLVIDGCMDLNSLHDII